MSKTEVRDYIIGLVTNKLKLFNISRGELSFEFDLVGSGLLDSMSFIDLVAELENKYELEIDFEQAAENKDFTSIGGLAQILIDTENAR